MTTQPVRYRRQGSQDSHTVLAVRVTPDNVDDVARWCRGRVEHGFGQRTFVHVRPLQSTIPARIGDYLVKAQEGQFWYPVKADLFETYYEKQENHIMEFAKAAVAAVGTVVTALTAALADNVLDVNEVGTVLSTVVVAGLTVYAVWRVPNTKGTSTR